MNERINVKIIHFLSAKNASCGGKMKPALIACSDVLLCQLHLAAASPRGKADISWIEGSRWVAAFSLTRILYMVLSLSLRIPYLAQSGTGSYVESYFCDDCIWS